MKMMTRFVMLLAIVTICLPAQADILVYAKTIKCWEAWETDPNVFNVDEYTVKGFLVLDLCFSAEDGTFMSINGAAQIEYWKDGRDKWYSVNEENWSGRRIANGNAGWVLERMNNQETDQTDAVMLKGLAKYTDIGFGRNEKREIAPTLNGYGLYNLDDLRMCVWTLRLQSQWTKCSNQDNDNIDITVGNIVDYLEDKGYNTEK